jgi:cytochrome c
MKTAWSKPAMLAAALLFGAAAGTAMAESAGEKLFKQQCAACHAVAKDAPMGMGPNLAGIVGKDAGIMEGYRYSAEFKKGLDGQKWTPELLESWLTDPQTLAPGTYMMYKQNDAAIRKSIIEYLTSVK